MGYTISVSQQVYNLLRQRAQHTQTTPDLLAENVLFEYLSQEEQEWLQAFEALIARVQASQV